MLRGNYTARIDVKGRLKVPTPFRRLIDEKHGSEFYITSLTGDNVRIYPLPEWESIEQRLSLLPTMLDQAPIVLILEISQDKVQRTKDI